MKSHLLVWGLVIVMTTVIGCSKKDKLSSLGEDTLSPEAAIVVAMYEAANAGGAAGDFSVANSLVGRERKYLASMNNAGMGTHNSAAGEDGVADSPGMSAKIKFTDNPATGEYELTDAMGMSIKMKFTEDAQVVFINESKIFAQNDFLLYTAQNISGTTVSLTAYAAGYKTNDPAVYIPSIWFYFSSGQPLAWLTINNPDELNNILTFMLSSFPDTATVTVNGSVLGGTMTMTMTAGMPSGKPTDTNPVTMTGTGTVTFDTGERWDISANLSEGDDGPVSGNQVFTSTSGKAGTMTFNADGSMNGTITKDGVTVATVYINADGAGTYTDVANGVTYDIKDVKPGA